MTTFPTLNSQVIYIMGTGRSGTTILDIVLSNSANITGCGEITHIFRDGFKQKSECACNETIENCEIWRRVYSEFSGEDLDSIQTSLDSIESHKSFFKNIFSCPSPEKLSLYNNINTKLFNNLANRPNTNFIIDSSKYAGRALALSNAFPNNVRVILLTRSPAGLYSSFKKNNVGEQISKSALQILLYYFYTLACFKLTELKLEKKFLKIQYEEFIKSPLETLVRIESWANIDLSKSKKILANNGDFIIGHIVTGNRLRKKGKIKLQQNSKPPLEKNNYNYKITISLMNLYRKLLRY